MVEPPGTTASNTAPSQIRCRVPDRTCRYCRSDDHVVPNETNFPQKYYCASCEQHFNPTKWPCPECRGESCVAQNPLDRVHAYYCYECDFAFNRLGASFDEETIWNADDHATFEDGDQRVEFHLQPTPDGQPREFTGEIRNVGETAIPTLGPYAVAVQHRVTETDWRTVFGNPEFYEPPERMELAPGDSLTFQLLFRPDGLGVAAGDTYQLSTNLQSGTYRVLYWGLESTDTVLASTVDLEFDHGW